MKVLITGGAGYLGSLLCQRLATKGISINVLDSLYYGGIPLLGIQSLPGLKFFYGDIRDGAAVREAMVGCQAVIHLAALVGYPACDQDHGLARSVNIGGTREAVNALEGRRLIYASTGSTYGKVEGVCTEKTPIAPATLYGETKAEGEKLAMEAGAVCLRFTTVFGVSPRMRYDLLLNTLVHDAVNTGQIHLYEPNAKRTFHHVQDTISTIEHALLQGYVRCCFNVGDEALAFTKLQAARVIAELTGCSLTVGKAGHDPELRDYEVDFSKYRTSFSPSRMTLGDGIKELMSVSRRLPNPKQETLSFVTARETTRHE